MPKGIKSARILDCMLPQHSPEIAAVELFFAVMKRSLIDYAECKSTNLQSDEGLRLIQQS